MNISTKDQPWKWTQYKDGHCQKCMASCCTMPVEIKAPDLVRLNLATQDEVLNTPKKLAKKLMKSGVISSYRESTGLFMITQKANDDCYFLDQKTRLCTVYEKRPDTCRSFPQIGPRPGYCPLTLKK